MFSCYLGPYLAASLTILGLLITFLVIRGIWIFASIRGTLAGRGLLVTGILLLCAGLWLATSTLGYPRCQSSPLGTDCPPHIGGVGRVCTNEYVQCAWTRNCLTVKSGLIQPGDCVCACSW